MSNNGANHNILLSTAYLAPVQYYSKLANYNNIFIEYFENYSKQSFRNRCNILSSNGPLALSIPVKRSEDIKVLIKDIKIDNDCRWKNIHLRAIESAYRSSPYYIYYADDILNILKKQFVFLIDLNNEIQQKVLELLGLEINILNTIDFKNVPLPCYDFSDSIHPKDRKKKPDNHFSPKSYYQVFNSKFGFVPNLSIVDLLFNMGPNSLNILKG
jgi:hypothetical protein